MQVRDWYVDSFKELRRFPVVKDTSDELNFTNLLKHIYHRHRFAQFPPTAVWDMAFHRHSEGCRHTALIM